MKQNEVNLLQKRRELNQEKARLILNEAERMASNHHEYKLLIKFMLFIQRTNEEIEKEYNKYRIKVWQ